MLSSNIQVVQLFGKYESIVCFKHSSALYQRHVNDICSLMYFECLPNVIEKRSNEITPKSGVVVRVLDKNLER